MSKSDDRPKLMVVDDEADNLALLNRTFRRNFNVFRAESALVAMDLLEKEGEMAVIISDQRMPQMSGIEFLSRTVERFPDTIRIILTGYTDVQDLVEAINNGQVFKYITKPWDAEELQAVVHQAAETYRVLKQRTNELNRTLRQESLFNDVMAAIRESLDYHSMLQTIVETLGKTFDADASILHPVDSTHETDASTEDDPALSLLPNPAVDRLLAETFSYVAPGVGESAAIADARFRDLDTTALLSAMCDRQVRLNQIQDGDTIYNQLVIPLHYQQQVLAVLALYRQNETAPWSSEDLQLLASVAEQAALAISQAKLYFRIQQQTKQMRTELAVARQIQMNLLRQSLPTVDYAKIQACCYPAREVGGDFFEVYLHPQGQVWLAVGDVSGKGVPAALFMASAISVLRRELSQESPPSPNIVMQNLNSILSEDLVSNNCFITMVLACYDPVTRTLVYANAGHIYPMVWSQQRLSMVVSGEQSNPQDQEDAEPDYLKVRGVPLGILPNWTAKAGQLTLDTGQVLLLASDGITEATLADDNLSVQNGQLSGKMLRQSGLWRLIQTQDELDLNQLLQQIQSRTDSQEDDQTILALEVL